MTKERKNLGQFLDDLVLFGTRELTAELGMPGERFVAPMRRTAMALVSQYARADFYVPASFDPRNLEIWRKYNEASRVAPAASTDRVCELAVEYGLTTRQIFGIIKIQRERATAGSVAGSPAHG